MNIIFLFPTQHINDYLYHGLQLKVNELFIQLNCTNHTVERRDDSYMYFIVLYLNCCYILQHHEIMADLANCLNTGCQSVDENHFYKEISSEVGQCIVICTLYSIEKKKIVLSLSFYYSYLEFGNTNMNNNYLLGM